MIKEVMFIIIGRNLFFADVDIYKNLNFYINIVTLWVFTFVSTSKQFFFKYKNLQVF